MPKRLTLQPHLSVEELAQRYRHAKDAIERSHYQIVWLLAPGKTTTFVQEVTGYSVNWIRNKSATLQPIRTRGALEISGMKIRAQKPY